MIKNYLRYSLSEPDKGTINSIEKYKSLTLKYPCVETTICSPYELFLKPAVYKFECWGSRGLGGYTKGTLLVTKPMKMYVYIGAQGPYNSVNVSTIGGFSGGGATDVRLNKTDNWYDTESLISRIMVAAGGGGAEWVASVGGNGGGINGGSSLSALDVYKPEIYDTPCQGSTQTSGTNCPDINIYHAYPGSFGLARFYQSNDYGGMGGGGYYGGTSYSYAFAGSGGSSFISGHKGCNAINESTNIVHTNTPFHYSGFVFSDTDMIPGNETMPLPFSNSKGIWNNQGGAFRITLVRYELISCKARNSNSKLNLLVLVLLHIKE